VVVGASTGDRAELSLGLDHPPWRLACRQELSVVDGGIQMDLSARNEGSGAVPVGLGYHPWLPCGRLQVPASAIWPVQRCIPIGPARPVTADEDLRSRGSRLSSTRCYTGLAGSTARAGGVVVDWEGPVTHVVVFTGQPGWACVEPVTHVNDAFNVAVKGWPGHGVRVLVPGEELAITVRIRQEPEAEPEPE